MPPAPRRVTCTSSCFHHYRGREEAQSLQLPKGGSLPIPRQLRLVGESAAKDIGGASHLFQRLVEVCISLSTVLEGAHLVFSCPSLRFAFAFPRPCVAIASVSATLGDQDTRHAGAESSNYADGSNDDGHPEWSRLHRHRLCHRLAYRVRDGTPAGLLRSRSMRASFSLLLRPPRNEEGVRCLHS